MTVYVVVEDLDGGVYVLDVWSNEQKARHDIENLNDYEFLRTGRKPYRVVVRRLKS